MPFPFNNLTVNQNPQGSQNEYGRDLTTGRSPGNGDYFGYYSGQAGAAGRELAGLNLFDPQTLSQLQQMFAPYFQSQQNNLVGQYNQTRGNLLSSAGENAGAVAAFKGYDPSSYVANARQRAENSISPSFFQSYSQQGSDQLQNLLNSVMQSGQFKAGNLGQAGNIFNSQAGNFLNQQQFREQLDSQPEWWEDALGGFIEGGGRIGAAYAGKP